MIRRWTRIVVALCMPVLVMSLSTSFVSADESSSSNYMVRETQFGAGGELEACSGSYCSKQSLGDTAAGSTGSANYQAIAGFNTTTDPMLEVEVSNDPIQLGVLTPDAAATGTATIGVRSYLSSGYIVQLVGPAPNIPAHTLNSPNVPTASAVGTEQFGVNLRENSSPALGADPQQIPDDTFSFGNYTTNYGQPNLFMYTDGATIASSNTSSGKTLYTLSMVTNISPVTPAGQYKASFSVVVTATF